ncbi:aspartate/glutamate racemase family protein [Paractinoplanes rhizophilus]|uniref:Aspartate/glutamate racemase family protein n=1 Tax=Paractinoplanes rhizophilus TaxID=1416877 RepID=A0ABW2HH60_9ACTN
MTTIGFLHTGDIHVSTFRRLREELAPGWQDLHIVDEGLLAEARREGITPSLAARIDARLHELADRGADIVVCTCSSLGEHAEGRTADIGVPVLRADRPMAEAAVAAGRRIAVVATVDSTLGPTGNLLRDAAARSARAIEIVEVRCPEAFALFEAGELDAYAKSVAHAARAAAPGVDVIVLAQPSAAPAASLLVDLPIPVLSSPRAAVSRAIAEAGPVR